MERPYQTSLLIAQSITGGSVELPAAPRPQVVSLDWLDQLTTQDVDAAACAEHIAPVTAGFNALLRQAVPVRDYRFIDNLLSSMQPARMRSDVMLAVLRTLFPVRDYLLHYRMLRDQVNAELLQRNKDAPRIMRGLF